MEMSTMDWIAYVLLIVGGLNWALVGLFSFNLVNLIFGSVAILETIVYVLVGLSAIWVGYLLTK